MSSRPDPLPTNANIRRRLLYLLHSFLDIVIIPKSFSLRPARRRLFSRLITVAPISIPSWASRQLPDSFSGDAPSCLRPVPSHPSTRAHTVRPR
ncbi:hypothetical protein PsYK624_028280 [Phanerochaete sordida]|uniref:Uncharacterized protein n=1 Tax=Phanerochaete sordida TaxID=48140 RepID=A0A9P3G261_9APHY|nr:hypothetical protein PsYK624_028280 [Phanerochaete sordida]